jgi:hypothetical protein
VLAFYISKKAMNLRHWSDSGCVRYLQEEAKTAKYVK